MQNRCWIRSKEYCKSDIGAAINTPDNDGYYPLHYAALYGYTEAAHLLLNAGAKLDDVEHHNKTALGLLLLSEAELTEAIRERLLSIEIHPDRAATATSNQFCEFNQPDMLATRENARLLYIRLAGEAPAALKELVKKLSKESLLTHCCKGHAAVRQVFAARLDMINLGVIKHYANNAQVAHFKPKRVGANSRFANDFAALKKAQKAECAAPSKT